MACLRQLQEENKRLEENVVQLTARRENLLAVNARLQLPPTALNNNLAGVGQNLIGSAQAVTAAVAGATASSFADIRHSRSTSSDAHKVRTPSSLAVLSNKSDQFYIPIVVVDWFAGLYSCQQQCATQSHAAATSTSYTSQPRHAKPRFVVAAKYNFTLSLCFS